MEEYILVEYPAKVINVEKAVHALHVDKSADSVEIRTEEEWRPPLRGDLRETRSLLVCRRTGKGDARMVGRVGQQARFQTMLDFITTTSAPSVLETRTRELVGRLDLAGLEGLASDLAGEQGQVTNEQEVAMASVPIPRFSPSSFPFFKSIEAGASAAPGPGGETAGGSSIGAAAIGRRKGKAASWMRLFSDTRHDFLDGAPRELVLRCKRLHRAHFEELTRLFRDRPVWLKSALQPYIKDVGPTEIKT